MAQENGGVAADMVKGAVAGAIGVWLMDQVGWGMYVREDPAAIHQEHEAHPDGLDPAHVMAGRLAHTVGAELDPAQPHPAGIAAHYALGILPAMLYAPLRHQLGAMSAGRGLFYGLTLFLVSDELLNPVLGLSGGPTEYPWQAHARGLVSHLVLGASTDIALDLLDRAA